MPPTPGCVGAGASTRGGASPCAPLVGAAPSDDLGGGSGLRGQQQKQRQRRKGQNERRNGGRRPAALRSPPPASAIRDATRVWPTRVATGYGAAENGPGAGTPT